jgi:hypothetical protein
MAEPSNIVGAVPEFTSDEGPAVTGEETAPEEAADEADGAGEGEGTPGDPPAPEEPAPAPAGEDIAREIRGLQQQKDELLKEIVGLRGERRELKQQEIQKVEDKIDQLEGVHPDDVQLVEKVLRSKGYMTKSEFEAKTYEQVKAQVTDAFLERYPEYKPENDPNDTNWNALQRELSLYRQPSDPKQIGDILERAHRAIARPSDARGVEVKKRQVATASAGSQPSASPKPSSPAKTSLTEAQVQAYRAGGWSEEEIAAMQGR